MQCRNDAADKSFKEMMEYQKQVHDYQKNVHEERKKEKRELLGRISGENEELERE